MSDSRNLVFYFGGGHPPLYFYTHWHGGDMPFLLATALDAGRNRWDDESYLARILVTHMVGQTNDTTSETGWGLSPEYTHADHPDIVVYLASQQVWTDGVTHTYDGFVKKHGLS